MLSISGLQFASPWMLAAAFAAPLLILAYLRRKAQKQQVVSSILILQTLKKQSTLRKSFKPPLRFFLELCALLLLAAAAAEPSWKDEAEHAAVILDTTLSMRARAGDRSRIEEAREALENWAESRDAAAKYTLFASAPKLQLLDVRGASRAELLSAVSRIHPSAAADSLEAAAGEAAQTLGFDRIVLVTDRRPELLPAAGEAGFAGKKEVPVEVISAGSLAPNLFLSDLRFAADVEQGASRVIASVGFSGEGEAVFRLNLLEEGAGQVPAASTAGRVAAGRVADFALNVPPGGRGERMYKVELRPEPGSPGGIVRDALAEDNLGWLSAQSAGGTRVLLVTDRQSPDMLGLSQIRSISPAQVRPAEYAAMKPAQLEQYRVIIFHESAPASPPRRASLLILPPPENRIFPGAGEFNEGKVSSWAGEHPLTSYIRFDLLKPQAGMVFAVPSWAQSVVNVEQGSIAAAGESQNVRFAAIGIQLLPFEGARTPVLSILTLNTLNWVMGGAQLSAGGVLTGSAQQLEAGYVWTVRTPWGDERKVDAASGTQAFTYEEPGPYTLSGVPAGGRSAGSAQRRLAAVNSFFPAESQTAAAVNIAVPAAYIQEALPQQDSSPLWPALAAIALALMLLELIIPWRSGERPVNESDRIGAKEAA